MRLLKETDLLISAREDGKKWQATLLFSNLVGVGFRYTDYPHLLN